MGDGCPIVLDQHDVLVTVVGGQLEVGVVVRPVVVRIVIIILSGREDHQVLARVEYDVNWPAAGKGPLVQLIGIVGKTPSGQIDRRIGRVV